MPSTYGEVLPTGSWRTAATISDDTYALQPANWPKPAPAGTNPLRFRNLAERAQPGLPPRVEWKSRNRRESRVCGNMVIARGGDHELQSSGKIGRRWTVVKRAL